MIGSSGTSEVVPAGSNLVVLVSNQDTQKKIVSVAEIGLVITHLEVDRWLAYSMR